jgi:hypothetical protein
MACFNAYSSGKCDKHYRRRFPGAGNFDNLILEQGH